MAVKRIVANINTDKVEDAKRFYGDILDMDMVMKPWLACHLRIRRPNDAASQHCLEGGSGTPVPDLSIEVDNLDEVYRRASAAELSIEYGPVTEPWGVRRFFLRDPFGRLVNILNHE